MDNLEQLEPLQETNHFDNLSEEEANDILNLFADMEETQEASPQGPLLEPIEVTPPTSPQQEPTQVTPPPTPPPFEQTTTPIEEATEEEPLEETSTKKRQPPPAPIKKRPPPSDIILSMPIPPPPLSPLRDVPETPPPNSSPRAPADKQIIDLTEDKASEEEPTDKASEETITGEKRKRKKSKRSNSNKKQKKTPEDEYDEDDPRRHFKLSQRNYHKNNRAIVKEMLEDSPNVRVSVSTNFDLVLQFHVEMYMRGLISRSLDEMIKLDKTKLEHWYLDKVTQQLPEDVKQMVAEQMDEVQNQE